MSEGVLVPGGEPGAGALSPNQLPGESIGDRIAAVAQSWIGTPYHHQMSTKRHGCDCLGLVFGVAQELALQCPDRLPTYSRDWMEVAANETLKAGLKRYLVERPITQSAFLPVSAGAVLLFRMAHVSIAKHVGIAISPNTMVHAQERRGVHLVALGAAWRSRLVSISQFPEPDR